ncbi:hypothetical protein GSI_09473 [Ganoderma sinense ZZ0214-1]|uniref:Reverse transcriptase n=1 Tax=Ganoderma sinense ZZ0214-1 TaxID=1077348 RepID=A0A2G8S6M8_9APHY|nr:hypothetical protein GSI_09473 [Ganoderma sinense ZZ0214-1]
MVEEEEEDKPLPPGFLPEWDGTEESLLDALATGRTLRNAPKLFVSATYTYSQQLAEQEYQKKEIRPVEEIVPKQYHEYLPVFSKEASERLPDHGPYDHAIELVPDARMFHSKVYPLSPSEQVELDKFINENLAKGYIQESKSPMSSPFFFNRYPLPLVSDLMDRLKKAKYFTKLDIHWGYNNVRIKTGDEWKAAFVTNRGLFEPNIMFFGLANSPSTFSALMNIFKDLIILGKVTIYLDDILIFTNNIEEHQKCEFEQPKVEYLGVLVSESRVEMDPVKVKGITAWPVPQNASDVQKFRSFVNFYWCFIKDFSAICKPLDRLTGNAPWKWEAEEQEAFDELKRRFTESPVLSMYDPDCKTREGEDSKWHPVAFHSESMSNAECNYEIYNKEMLTIIHALQAWHHYLEGLPSVFKIQSDHKNLKYWKTAQNLTRRQAQWALYLSRFEFIILHKPGTSNGRADTLSRRPDHQTDDADDNLNRDLLQSNRFRVLAAKRGHMSVVPEKALLRHIRECGECKQEVADALSKLDKLGPARLQNDLVDWNTEQGLLLYRSRVYVPKDNALRAEIVRIHHDLPPAGHPGQAKTVELEYVETCDTCCHGKTSHAKPHGPLQPNEVPDGPGQVVTCDFITGLPDVDRYNALQLIADRHGKIIHLIPCTEEIDAEGTADNFIREWFRLYGLPRKIVSDHGPQFSSKLFRAVLKGLGIESAMSTAYHPQTDGQSERWNQEIEAYLRMYCSRRRDDWVKWLPIAEFAFNSHVHSATGYSPFYLMYGFEPQFHIPMLSTAVPSADERREELQRMKEYYDHYVRDAPEFKDSQKVWLDTRNFRVPGVSRKLVDRYAGPYLVKRKVGNLAYELKLSKDLALHPVFHVSLLLPHKESQLPGRHPPEPASIEVEGEEEYEVEEVLESRRYGRWKKLQYLMHWMGWGPEHDSWEDAADLANAPKVVQKFHSTHPDAPSPLNKKTKL